MKNPILSSTLYATARILWRIKNLARGILYDLIRYLRYSGISNDLKNNNIRNYQQVMIYHGIEKSLSFSQQKENSGWANALKIGEMLNAAKKSKEYGYHDIAAHQVLKKFLKKNECNHSAHTPILDSALLNIEIPDNLQPHGVINYRDSDFKKGKLEAPENFFLSRYTLREFNNETVDPSLIERAIKLAMKAPSVCNRQAWRIYVTSDKENILKALSFQGGNRGFTDKISNLALIASDQQAFFSGEERYQHWIDGGIFSASLVYAFHSLGIASCCLNWSQSPQKDKAIRKQFKIRPHDSIIMMLAFGHPQVENSVCASARKPIKHILEKLEAKNRNEKK